MLEVEVAARRGNAGFSYLLPAITPAHAESTKQTEMIAVVRLLKFSVIVAPRSEPWITRTYAALAGAM